MERCCEEIFFDTCKISVCCDVVHCFTWFLNLVCSLKHQVYSRAYINFKRPEDVIEFAEFFEGHLFVNEKGNFDNLMVYVLVFVEDFYFISQIMLLEF